MSNPQPEKPSLWQRFKIGVKGFASHAIGYIPRGIALTGAIFAGSAILEGMTGATLLGISTASNPALLNSLLTHLALGSTISGVIGATSDIHCACKDQGSSAVATAGNPLIGKQEAQLGQAIVKGVATSGLTHAVGEQVFNSGLPLMASAAKHLAP